MDLEVRLSPARITAFYAVLAAVDAALVGATLLSDLQHDLARGGLARQLDLKLEGNVAVWWSSAQLLLVGLAALGVARAARDARLPPAPRALWVLAGLSFLALSADETAQLHERVGIRFQAWFGDVPGLTDGGWPAFAWLVALLPLIIAFVMSMATIVKSTWRWHARAARLLMAGTACWLGVLAAEFVQAQLVRAGLPRAFQGVVEEGLEVVGASLFLVGLIELLRAASAARTAANAASGTAPKAARDRSPGRCRAAPAR